MENTRDFLDRLSKMPLDSQKNKTFIERGIQLIEWKEVLSEEEQKLLSELKASLVKADKTENSLRF
jgi:hypothetical protein